MNINNNNNVVNDDDVDVDDDDDNKGVPKIGTVRKILDLIYSLKIEPFMFFYVLSMMLSDITFNQLVQDKLCLNSYNQTVQYCAQISKLSTTGTTGATQVDIQIRDAILGDLAQFNTYSIILGTMPALVYVLFVGSWTDSYIHGRKILLLIVCVGYIGCYLGLLVNAIYFQWNVYYILLCIIPYGLSGGWSVVWLTCYSYMTNNSPKEYRFIKFLTFEVTVAAAGSLGTYLGGYLIGSGNLQTTDKHIHNYNSIFIICLSATGLAFLWVLLMINESRHQRRPHDQTILTAQLDNSIVCINDEEIQPLMASTSRHQRMVSQSMNDEVIVESAETIGKMDAKFSVRKMFNIDNVRDMFRTALKPRPQRRRKQLWLMYLSMCIVLLALVKDTPIIYPYVEKVYEWDAQQFSTVRSIVSAAVMVATAPFGYLLSGLFKVDDTKLGILGYLSSVLSLIAIGSIPSPLGLYLMYLLGCASGLCSIAVRSLISKMIATESESGKVFSVLATFETAVPTIGSLVFSTIFRYTISWYPSLVYHLVGGLMFVPIVIFIWIDINYSHLY